MNQNIIKNIEPILKLAKDAGKLIMSYYNSGVDVQIKDDKSPVTKADIEANDLIVSKLKECYPEVITIAEESDEKETVNAADLSDKNFWLIDPLDGTKSFIRGTGEFTVNIGLVKKCKPLFGVIYVPAKDELYYTGNDGKSYKQLGDRESEEIKVKHPSEDGYDFVVSHSHYDPRIDDFTKNFKVRKKISGSSSIKFCMIASGEADIYPRFGRTMEWDTAAGHAIVNAAGGKVCTVDGNELTYAKQNFENPDFVASGVQSKS